MKKNNKVMFKTFGIVSILASTGIGVYGSDQQESSNTRYVTVVQQDHGFDAYSEPATLFTGLAGDAYQNVELHEENTPKIKKKQKKVVPARFNTPNSKAKSSQERAYRYEMRSNNKENIKRENRSTPLNKIEISQKPMARLQPPKPFSSIEADPPRHTFTQPAFHWSHIPLSHEPYFNLTDIDPLYMEALPEWDEIAGQF